MRRALPRLTPVVPLLAATLALLADEALAQETPPNTSPPPPQSSGAPTAPPIAPPTPSPSRPAPPAEPPPDWGNGVGVLDPQSSIRVLTWQPPAAPRGDTLAFRADFKLPFALATDFNGTSGGVNQTILAPVPQLVLGIQYGRVGMGAGLGFERIGSNSIAFVGGGTMPPSMSTSSTSTTELLIAPTFTLDLLQSHERKVSLYLLGAAVFAAVLQSNQSASSDLGFQFALGTDAALYDSFRIGLEVGPVGQFFTGNNGGNSHNEITLYTALVGTFVYPR
jgi:hypothetical protein